MSLDSRNLEIIRHAVGDSGSLLFTDSEISDIYEAVNNSTHYTIAHLLLSRGMALVQPTAPTAPTLDAVPDTSVALWEKMNSQDLNLFAQQLSLYREQLNHTRQQAELLRAQATLYLELSKGGEVI
jgi:hypothetical protein